MASCTLFSPKSLCPQAIIGVIVLISKVLVTTIIFVLLDKKLTLFLIVIKLSKILIFMNLREIEYYYFIKEYSDINFNLISKINKINIIYSYKNKSNLNDLLLLEKYCKKNKIRLYISNYTRDLNFIKIYGVHISSENKLRSYNLKKNAEIIGTAHNQLEYNVKKNFFI
jgi:ABC-type multidrug transport system fused ATPase/permease subunit